MVADARLLCVLSSDQGFATLHAYERNSQAAREIAEEYFDATEVAGRIIEIALGDGRTEVPASV